MVDIFKSFQFIIVMLMILFILLPIEIPVIIIGWIDSMIGIIIIICVLFLLFIYTHPLLGSIGLIATYVLYTRAQTKKERILMTQQNKNRELLKMNTETQRPMENMKQKPQTLEEDIIEKNNRMMKNKSNEYIYTKFKPVNESIGTARKL